MKLCNSSRRWIALAFFSLGTALAAQPLSNRDYRIEVKPDGSVEVMADHNLTSRLLPSFTILYSAADPGYDHNNSNYLLAPRTSLRWTKFQQPLEVLNRWLKEEQGLAVRVSEDHQGRRTWDYGAGRLQLTGPYAQGTTNPFLVGERIDIYASKATVRGRTIAWEYAVKPGFAFAAELTLPEGSGDPQITYTLNAAKAGYFSVCFTGAPGIEQEKNVIVPQQASAGGKLNHVVAEVNEKLPRVHITDGRKNIILVAAPESVPFTDRLINFRTSRFGTMIRKENGILYPVIFAPVMGTETSQMRAGESCRFRLLFVSRPGDWRESFRYVAENIYGLSDLRDNSGAGSRNNTLSRVRDYLGNRNGKNYAMWHAEQKYYDYWSDQSGIFKPFSPLYGLSAAIILDDEEFYWNRALPVVEFALSRTSNIFAPYEISDTGQVSERIRGVGKPYSSLPQLVSLWSLYQNRTYAFRYHAEQKAVTSSPVDLLAAWKLTGSTDKLQAARAAGERASQGNGGDYMDFLELYEVIPEPQFLEAALSRLYARISTGVNLFPTVPDATMSYDRGGRVPIHAHSFGRHKAWGFPPPEGLETVEQSAPAWRGSEIGLEAMASPHRAELWPNHPPQTLRIASLAADPFLRTVARWGMVGRYGNYAGDNRTERSLITEKPDGPEAPIWKLTYSSINPGHAWEFIGAMIDCLVTDCFDRSGQRIAFPGCTMSGSPFRVQSYGADAGRFYDEPNVRLWLPTDLLVVDNVQVDWLAGWGNGKLYLAFWNQSSLEEKVTVELNPSRAQIGRGAVLRQWRNNQAQAENAWPGGKLTFQLSGKGIHAFAIDKVQLAKTLQAKMFDATAPVLGPSSIKAINAPFGKVHGTLISLGRGLTTAFVYTDALPENVISARLEWRQGGGEWTSIQDDIFPFEFSLPLDESRGDLECVMEVESVSVKTLRSDILSLALRD